MLRQVFATIARMLPTAIVAAYLAGPAMAQGVGGGLPPISPAPADPAPAPMMPMPSDRIDPVPPAATTRDDRVRKVAEEAAEAPQDVNPLPPAAEKPGGSAPPTAPPADAPDGYKPAPDRIPLGKQTASLSVEVIAPGVMNVGQAATIRIVVRNTGAADAMAVRVTYDLARELTLVGSQPEAQTLGKAEPGALHFVLNTVAAGSEQVLVLKVKPNAVASIDHAALVTLMVGGRARTVIQEPMLKVEQSVTPSKVLQGQQVQFRIAVSNPGSGPARNVVIRAKLSPGLKCEGEDVVEQTIPILQAKERIELDPLVADTFAGGEQTCTVTAFSDDIAAPSADAKLARTVVVLRPELALDLVGPETRYTDTLAEYRVNVENPGTAAAKNVRVSVTLPPNSGKLQKPLPPGAEWNAATSRLSWTIANIEPKAKASSKFLVRLGGIGAFRVVAEAKSGPLLQTDAVQTNVSGFADIDLVITERKRVLDVGEKTVFDIKMKNLGTKPARNILLRAKLSANLEVTDTSGIDDETRAYIDKPTGELVFPRIASLAPGREQVVSVLVNATKSGVASCRVFLLHDDIADPDARLEDVAHTRVTPGSETTLK